jgi:thioredoxin-like negative regulator of GroEL
VKNNPANNQLRNDLAELYAKLKKFEQADKVLRETLLEQRGKNAHLS